MAWRGVASCRVASRIYCGFGGSTVSTAERKNMMCGVAQRGYTSVSTCVQWWVAVASTLRARCRSRRWCRRCRALVFLGSVWRAVRAVRRNADDCSDNQRQPVVTVHALPTVTPRLRLCRGYMPPRILCVARETRRLKSPSFFYDALFLRALLPRFLLRPALNRVARVSLSLTRGLVGCLADATLWKPRTALYRAALYICR